MNWNEKVIKKYVRFMSLYGETWTEMKSKNHENFHKNVYKRFYGTVLFIISTKTRPIGLTFAKMLFTMIGIMCFHFEDVPQKK